jgi:hypothetical protein
LTSALLYIYISIYISIYIYRRVLCTGGGFVREAEGLPAPYCCPVPPLRFAKGGEEGSPVPIIRNRRFLIILLVLIILLERRASFFGKKEKEREASVKAVNQNYIAKY